MFSWMRGPVGTAGGAGAGPRPVTTKWQSMAELSWSQSQPSSALMVAAVTARALADAVSAIQSSTPLARFTMNDSHFPSGEKPGSADAHTGRHHDLRLDPVRDPLERDAENRAPGCAARSSSG